MVDGILHIPLSGSLFNSGPEGAVAATACPFVAGPENRLVETAIHSLVEEPNISYNPLVFYGPSGTGKTHIARGLVSVWKERNRRHRVLYATAVDFARELNEAIESQAVEEFRAKHRAADLLVIEDLQQLVSRKSGKLNVQEELLHTLDAMLADHRWIVVTASAAPVELHDLLPGLQSRLMSGLTIPLSPPGPEARLALLRQLAAFRKIALPDSIAKLLAEELQGTAADLSGALTDLAMSAGFESVPIDLHAAKQYLAKRSRKFKNPTIHEIALATARFFSLRLSDLKSSVRQRSLVVARGVAVYLARRYGGVGLDEIGRYFGGRDHTTILHSYRRTDELHAVDPIVHRAVECLHRQLWKE